MIKLYKKKFIANSSVEYEYKYEFEGYLPKVIKTGYKKVYKGVWEATVLVKRDDSNEKVLNNLKDYLFQIYDKNDEYIGAFIPNKPDEAILNRQSTITINCNHALITLLDSIFPEDIETDSEDVNTLFNRVLSHQKQRIWKYKESAHANEATDIKLEKQNGLLNPFLKIAEQLSPLYYFSYDTEDDFPWTISLNRVTDTPTARIREGYNLLDYKLTRDPSNIYNRLYAYGEVEELTNVTLNHKVDAKEIKKEAEAWNNYEFDYAAWKNEQIRMQQDRDRVLKRREELVNSGVSPSELPKLPPRPSTVKPPQKPSITSRVMVKNKVTIADVNPTKKEYLEDINSIKVYGLKERILEFKDIADPTILYNTAKRIFKNRTNEVYDYGINAADLNKLLVKPIPFDWIRLGTTISFQTYRAGKAIEDNLVIVEESKEDIDGAPEKISVTLQLKNSASAPTVSYSTASQLLSKIEETEADIIKAYRSADGKNTIYSGKDQPPNPKLNDIWYKQTIDDKGKPTIEMWIFNGSIWVNPFADLDQIDEAIARNEKELDALLEEAKHSMINIENDIKKNSEDIDKKVKELDDQIAAKINDIQKALEDAAAKAEQAVKDATNILQGNLDALEKKMHDDVTAKISEAQTELLAKATELVNGVEVKVDEKIGLLQKTIAQTTETTDGLKQKVTEFEESINGLSLRMAENEKTANSAKTAVSEIQNSVNSLSSTFQTLQETNDSLSKRLTSVEQDATGLRTLIESTEKNLGDEISNLNTRIETAEGSYTTLTKTVNDVTEKANKISSTVDENKATIAQQTKDISATSKKISSLSTTVTQTNDKVETIITDYAKKSDLSGLATKEFTTTQIEARAGELETVISSQKEEIDNTIAGIKARPTYTIGKDGYWYKDGKKTDTLAKGKDGSNGGEFGWNLLRKGDTKVTDSTSYNVINYDLDEQIPNGAAVSFLIRLKGKRDYNQLRPHNTNTGTDDHYMGIDNFLMLPEDSDKEFRTYTHKGYWNIGTGGNTTLKLYIGQDSTSTKPISIEWAKLVYGHEPSSEFAPAKSEIYGKDAHLYTGTTPPKDTKQMWFNPNDMTTYVYINGKWVDMNKVTKDQVVAHTKTINELKVTDTQIKSDISQIKSSNTVTNTKLNTLDRDLSKTVSTISEIDKKVKGTQEQVTKNTTQITQTTKQVSTIISSYAKKTDLNGLMNEEQVTTIATAEAGKVRTTLSSKITTIDDKVNGLKARPIYSIGTDGYWYKDGKKTDTKATGPQGPKGGTGATGPQGKPGTAGKDGHTLNVNMSLAGEFRNHKTKNVQKIMSATYDGNPITLTDSNTKYYIDKGTGTWIPNKFTDYWADWDRDYNYIASKIVVTYNGLTAEAIARLDNINDGAEFGWNLLLKGDTKVTDSKDYMVRAYNLVDNIPEGTLVSLVIRVKGKRSPNYLANYNSGGSWRAINSIALPNDSDKEFRTYVMTDNWRGNKGGNKQLYIYVGDYNSKDRSPISIEWAKLVYGDKPTMSFTPARSEINGKIYSGSTPPSDHNALWFNTKDKETYTYYNGQWYNINTNIKQTIHDVQDTVSSHTRTISTNTGQITSLKQDLSGFKTVVANKNYLSIINQQTGKQTFQVTDGKTTGKLLITPTTVYINDATIKSSHIESLSASKLTAGTIDCKKVNVINMNASSITTGKLSGYRGYWDLNSGELYSGYYYNNFRLNNGVAKFSDSNGEGVVIESGKITLSTNITAESSYTKVGEVSGSSIWNNTKDLKNVRFAHREGTTMTLSYDDGQYYHPYIVFDNYNVFSNAFGDPYITIKVMESTLFEDVVHFYGRNYIKFANGMRIAPFDAQSTQGGNFHGIFIGEGFYGLYISPLGVYTNFKDGYEKIGNTTISIHSFSPFGS